MTRDTPNLVLTAGPFGQALGQRLVERHQFTMHPLSCDRAALAECIQGRPFVAVASWRPWVDAYELVDDLCFEFGVPWSLSDTHGELQNIGPLVVPGRGACYHCYRKRFLSHHSAPEREALLENAYRHSPELGPHGFIQAQVLIAEGGLLDDMRNISTRAGRLRGVDVLSGAVLETEILGVHACPRCRANAPRGGDRFVNALVPALERVLQ